LICRGKQLPPSQFPPLRTSLSFFRGCLIFSHWYVLNVPLLSATYLLPLLLSPSDFSVPLLFPFYTTRPLLLSPFPFLPLRFIRGCCPFQHSIHPGGVSRHPVLLLVRRFLRETFLSKRCPLRCAPNTAAARNPSGLFPHPGKKGKLSLPFIFAV